MSNPIETSDKISLEVAALGREGAVVAKEQ
jgi:hypothetical protein